VCSSDSWNGQQSDRLLPENFDQAYDDARCN
jgi:hypothetical protein